MAKYNEMVFVDKKAQRYAEECCLYDPKKKRCILDVICCPEDCSFREEDPRKRIDQLQKICDRAKSPNLKNELQREIRSLWQRFAVGMEYAGWMEGYYADQRRGSGGGHSEGDTSNSAASLKQKLKDNRPIECKQTQAQREEYKEELKNWEETHEQLPKLSKMPFSRNKVDSYTGEPIK